MTVTIFCRFVVVAGAGVVVAPAVCVTTGHVYEG